MADTIEVVFEKGVLRPLEPVDLRDGQHARISVVPMAMTPEDARAYVRRWGQVYEGLFEEDIEAIEAIALDRSNFMRPVPEDEE